MAETPATEDRLTREKNTNWSNTKFLWPQEIGKSCIFMDNHAEIQLEIRRYEL
jgi:hypothetical protein